MKSLEGKVALVTGASRGIGRAISIGLAQQGANLVLAARTISDLEATRNTILQYGARAEVVPTDVTSEQQIIVLFQETLERFGKLDILVNNAGVFVKGGRGVSP
jgi:NAD(P)-dependent dehydrogenase (short-subunit alcohol dehydrogenase family)